MLEVVDLWKFYEGSPLLRGVSFCVAQGETVCLLGPSGSGKSTLLRIIAGLEASERGEVCWDGQDLVAVPAHQRSFGLVFQDYALFPHLTVEQNVAFGLKMQSRPASEVTDRVAKILAQVNLSTVGRRTVTDLSGGEQQRVALARALAPEPRLLMFDEPLGALDRNLREHLMIELRSILRASRVPAVYVTHDQEEAFTLADRVLLLHEGQIVRSGTPPEVWGDPGSAWVASFLGVGNVVNGMLREDGRVVTAAGIFAVKCASPHRVGEPVTLLLRPAGAWPLVLGGGPVPEGCVSGRVTDVVFHLERFKVSLSNGLFFYLADPPKLGEEICLELPPSAITCLP